ncbi:mandelate racemase/muconate lactonizing enzyme family protein [Myxococcota bacterium]|nr:mandelate racemase/muconate lactonizing enzyme family protein [Myxococcota bacterium]
MLRNSLALWRIREISPPFKQVFSSRVLPGRAETSMLLQLQNSDGISGWGEAIPCQQHNTEAAEITKNLREILPRLITFSYDSADNIDSSVTALTTWYRQKMENPRPLLAEIALLSSGLLDLLSREKGLSLVEMLGPMATESIAYTPTIPLAGRGLALSMLHTIAAQGYSSVKLAMGRDLEREMILLKEMVQRTGDSVSIIVDFEGRLTAETAPDIIEKLLNMDLRVVEQPLPADDLETIPALMEAYQGEISFILDQSVVTSQSLDWCMDHCPPGVVNLSISKNGGFFTVGKLAKKAQKRNWQVALGSSPGESSLLTAFTRILAARHGTFIHHEGNFATQFLLSDITEAPLVPNEGGSGTLEVLRRNPGCGVTVAPELLRDITKKSAETPFL